MARTATASAATSAGHPVLNQASPAYQHSYRHGVVPTRATASKMAQWARPPAVTSPLPLVDWVPHCEP